MERLNVKPVLQNIRFDRVIPYIDLRDIKKISLSSIKEYFDYLYNNGILFRYKIILLTDEQFHKFFSEISELSEMGFRFYIPSGKCNFCDRKAFKCAIYLNKIMELCKEHYNNQKLFAKFEGEDIDA